MNNLNFKFFFVALIIICASNDCTLANKSFQAVNIHIRYGFTNVGEGKVRSYQFNNVPETSGFLTRFPIEEIAKKIPSELLDKWNLDFSIYTSFEDAELAMVENLDLSARFMNNIIDIPLKNGTIGDNCWHQLSAGLIKFIRNNVLVSISPKIDFYSSVDLNYAESLAKIVDSAINESQKIKDANLIPAPTIHSVEIVSALPGNWAGFVNIKVNATDQTSKQLFFRKYASGFAIISETGDLTLSLNKNADSSDVANKAKVKIWVWNEDHVVASMEQFIPF